MDRRIVRHLLALAAALAVALPCGCGAKADSGNPDTGDSGQDTDQVPECEDDDVVLDIIGPEAPVVGDTWTLWLRCNGVTLLGATILQADPPEFAHIEPDTTNATFLMAGVGELSLQVGRHSQSTKVTVNEAEKK